jgi:methylated-DNA-protein-cysteine methyltransferase-like protein
MTIFEKVYEVVKKIPSGKVATYGQVAKLVGTTPRVVGFALHANPYEGRVPCHRVVNRYGRLAESFAFGGKNEQKMRLVSEGVEVEGDGSISLAKFAAATLDSAIPNTIF